MSNTNENALSELQNDRLVTREDAARIISALNAIAYRNGRRFIKPTLTTDTVVYDGETHNVSELLDDLDSDFMTVTGDTTYFDNFKEYTFSVQLKRARDTWADDTTDVLTYSFTLENNE